MSKVSPLTVVGTLLFALMLGVLAWQFSVSEKQKTTPITKEEVKKTLTFKTILNEVKNEKALLYDVRTPQEYQAGYFEGALNLPLSDIQNGTSPAGDKTDKIYVYCRSGNRSNQAKQALAQQGYTNVTDLGGITDVQQLGGTLVTTNSDSLKLTAQLEYLIEEEKLAQDIYTQLYEEHKSRVFGNILNAEETHQKQVLALLEARNIEDPRQSIVGAFQNKELQELYNTLLEKGMASEKAAIEVGIAIEKKDIEDLKRLIATTDQEDVKNTLTLLLQTSEQHLAAFNRQLSTAQ